MQAYLAAKYMSGPKADAILSRTAPKKKKRKTATADSNVASSSMIRDDDVLGWDGRQEPEEDDDDPDARAVVDSDRSFKKRRMEASSWTTVREGAGGNKVEDDVEETPADEQPQVVGVESQPENPFVGGLLSASQLRQNLPRLKGIKEVKPSSPEPAPEAQETIYRDASGRAIDTKAERAEAARKKREREEREAAKMEWGKGLVQRGDQEKMKGELEKMKGRDLARYADDKELNDRLKGEDRWNDPAAAFMTKKRTKGPRKPEYSGPPPPPNRFGIKPGYRWDGVDRSNGFEKKLFQHHNEKRRKGLESYQWSVDDM
ncbi:hypothetical protein JAAARDRAFT_69001 [Jaapia argillacea MUCL 33604]|uniref:Pre-mRNA-splicing factor CWC26 n=1 Tax=Jaapia argillacea MUCL 33604 TaxID=933084 RepID=A0A067Q7E1_9AGAM|nr:hypothetical protein JAAARDRAFT_69001 [Jaapia argillacea MUCL 33604]